MDNVELIQLREALLLIKRKLLQTVDHLSRFADKHKDLPTLGFTHYQPAQLVTVGKRATLWLQDFLMDFHRLEREIDGMRVRGVKGTTGSQATFLQLFGGDHAKVEELNRLVVKKMGFPDDSALAVGGQVSSLALPLSKCMR